MAIEVKRTAYKSSAGVHFPDAVINTEEYYAVDFNHLIDAESETVTDVTWETPAEITVMDSYINTEFNEAHVKLKPTKAGIYKIVCVITSEDTGRVQKPRKEVILRVD